MGESPLFLRLLTACWSGTHNSVCVWFLVQGVFHGAWRTIDKVIEPTFPSGVSTGAS